jgi:OOP family OmpA-OmpF porin
MADGQTKAGEKAASSATLRIFFPFRGKEPRSDENYDYSHLLAEVARKLREHPAARVRIMGHTDGVGESRVNHPLSLARAESVKSRLIALGVGEERLSTEGAGKDKPIATNDTEDGRAQSPGRVRVVSAAFARAARQSSVRSRT